MRVSYVGDRSSHAPSEYDLNLPRTFGPGSLQSLRPYQPWGEIRWIDPRGNARTHQLQIGSTRRPGDLTYQFEYQFTSSLTDGAGPAEGWGSVGSVDYPFIASRNHGAMDGIVRHQAITNWVYNLPFGKGRRFVSDMPAVLNHILGGWQLSGIGTFRTGTPYHINYTGAAVGYPSSGRVDVVGDWRVPDPGVEGWFNPAAFAAPAPFTLGNMGRNSMWAPGYWNIDAGLMKNFRFSERYNLQFRSEWFNTFNHPNPNPPGNNVSVSSTLGKTTSFSAARVVLFGLKLNF